MAKQPPQNPPCCFWFWVTPALSECAWRSRSAHNSPTAPALQSQRLIRPLPHPALPPSPHKHTYRPFLIKCCGVKLSMLKVEARRPSVFIMCAVYSFLRDGTDCGLLLICGLICKLTAKSHFLLCPSVLPHGKISHCVRCSVQEEVGGGSCNVSLVIMRMRWRLWHKTIW